MDNKYDSKIISNYYYFCYDLDNENYYDLHGQLVLSNIIISEEKYLMVIFRNGLLDFNNILKYGGNR